MTHGEVGPKIPPGTYGAHSAWEKETLKLEIQGHYLHTGGGCVLLAPKGPTRGVSESSEASFARRLRIARFTPFTEAMEMRSAWYPTHYVARGPPNGKEPEP